MPSIFVWKAMNPISSSSIRYYSGSNWFLEEHPTYSVSYLYCRQQTLSQGMAFETICMPQNWVGSEIMEIMEVPYQRISEDADGILEQLGGWMRYRSKHDIPFELDTLEREFQQMMNPSDKPSAKPSTSASASTSASTSASASASTSASASASALQEPCMIRIPATFVAPPPSFPRKQHHNRRQPNRNSVPFQIAIPSR